MMVSCARSDHAAAAAQVRLIPGSLSGPLVHGMHLAEGVHVALDLTTPDRWHAVSCAAPYAGHPLLGALVGDVSPERITPAQTIGHRLPDAPRSAAPWLRVAAVDALDRWLQTPLDQGLLDAERGVARGRAARTLPQGPARAVLTGEALRMARRSSRDVVFFLRRLGRHSRPVPAALRSAVKNVVDGYSELVDDVAGPDHELASVLDGWRRLSRRLGGGDRPAAGPPPTPDPPSAVARSRDRLTQAMSMIDPRQVRARVFALSSDPASPEVTASEADGGSVLVRVPAFGAAVAPEVAARLLVRLVDRRSAEAKGHALLRASQTEAGCFEATISLYGLEVADVRADVADALSDIAPVADDADEGLCEARRAVVFLAEWRRLVGLAQLGTAAPAALQLRRLAARLQPGRARTAVPLFTAGPSSADLEALADLGDDELLRRLRGDGPLGERLRVMTAGPAALLVAEVAALFLGSAG